MDKHTQETVKRCYVVLGMHRSGTSLVSSILHRLGVHMGDRFRQPDEFNPRGYWEDLDWRDINQEILKLAGGSWYNPPEKHKIHTSILSIEQKIIDLVNRKSQRDVWGFKDPRTCLTIQWIDKYLVNPFYIYVTRDQMSIIESLEMRSYARGYIESRQHWHKLLREYDLRRFEFMIRSHSDFFTINYEDLINDTLNSMIGFADALGVTDHNLVMETCKLVTKHP